MRPKGKSKMKPRGILQYKCWEINPAINQAPQIVAHSLIQILSCIVILLIIMLLPTFENLDNLAIPSDSANTHVNTTKK